MQTEHWTETQLSAVERPSATADLRLAPDFVAVVATHVRTARNGQVFAQEVEHLLGVPCEVINGTSEAELVLLGTAVTEQVTDALAVIDVGWKHRNCFGRAAR